MKVPTATLLPPPALFVNEDIAKAENRVNLALFGLMLRYILSADSFVAAEVRIPTLVLLPRATPDIDAMLEAAQVAGWEALRLESWRVPTGLNGTMRN